MITLPAGDARQLPPVRPTGAMDMLSIEIRSRNSFVEAAEILRKWRVDSLSCLDSAGIFNKKAKKTAEQTTVTTEGGGTTAPTVPSAVPQAALAGDNEYVGVTGSTVRRR